MRFKFLVFIPVFVGCAGIFRKDEKVNVIFPEESFKLGKELFKQGKYKDAIKKFKEVLYVKGFGPIADSAQIYLAESYLRMKDYDMAILEFSTFIENYPGTLDTLKALAYLGIAKAYSEKFKNLYLDISEIDNGLLYAQRVLDTGIFPDSARKIISEIKYKKATKLLLEADVYNKLKTMDAWKLYLSEFLKLYPDDPRADSIRNLIKK